MPRCFLLLAAVILLALAACERTGGTSGPYIGVGGGVNRATQ